MSKFLLRLDDVCSTMDWDKFDVLKKTLVECNIKPVLGVIPSNFDCKLIVDGPRQDFWHLVRQWASDGWIIAQHGYTHEYVTACSGLLKINPISEFAGLSYEIQYNKLQAGKEIMLAHKVWQPVFMAPAHSFDMTTISVLRDLGFKVLTDGYGVFSYKIGELSAVPQLFSTPKHFGFGFYTICLHINSMTMEEIEALQVFIRENRRRFVSVDDVLTAGDLPIVGPILRYLSEICLRGVRKMRRI